MGLWTEIWIHMLIIGSDTILPLYIVECRCLVVQWPQHYTKWLGIESTLSALFASLSNSSHFEQQVFIESMMRSNPRVTQNSLSMSQKSIKPNFFFLTSSLNEMDSGKKKSKSPLNRIMSQFLQLILKTTLFPTFQQYSESTRADICTLL